MFDVVSENLKKNEFDVTCFATAKEAAQYLKEQIHDETVGIGGSMTVEEMGLYDMLAEQNEVSWHHRVPEGMTANEVRDAENAAAIYISSVNGLAETGELINIDNCCNRVATIFYGHKKVYLLVGKNKIASDYDSALFRARNIAGPLNAKRLNRKTPCAIKGDKCYDCNSPERICRGLAVMWKKPAGSDIEVILIDENLGY